MRCRRREAPRLPNPSTSMRSGAVPAATRAATDSISTVGLARAGPTVHQQRAAAVLDDPLLHPVEPDAGSGLVSRSAYEAKGRCSHPVMEPRWYDTVPPRCYRSAPVAG